MNLGARVLRLLGLVVLALSLTTALFPEGSHQLQHHLTKTTSARHGAHGVSCLLGSLSGLPDQDKNEDKDQDNDCLACGALSARALSPTPYFSSTALRRAPVPFPYLETVDAPVLPPHWPTSAPPRAPPV